MTLLDPTHLHPILRISFLLNLVVIISKSYTYNNQICSIKRAPFNPLARLVKHNITIIIFFISNILLQFVVKESQKKKCRECVLRHCGASASLSVLSHWFVMDYQIEILWQYLRIKYRKGIILYWIGSNAFLIFHCNNKKESSVCRNPLIF
jgi:hypothetical protein